ncbi:KpsF/GutQ family protein [alpha proteobacterium IMCC14465]|uniref:KpsF/GutQ family protein n=1 Tax=alpha proteobacterium IMCC14465 TaxID=1220535 RepID=J9DYQ6_9PROT|nr:KpsF/GutQ family protein [alpha proteobacterium IMCC14465]
MTDADNSKITPIAPLDSASRTLDAEIAGLEKLKASLSEDFVASVEMLAGVRGRIIISGMGKSGHIGRKIAATLASTGTPAQFVHPGEASHGDLGMITAQDIVLGLSWSGETPELGNLLAYVKRFKIPLIGITSNPNSALGEAATVCLTLPKAEEACPYGLAPTTSTTMQLAMGDALAVALLQRRGFTNMDFKSFHPGGKLGAGLMILNDIMHKADMLPLCEGSMLMSEALMIMTGKGFGCLGVINMQGDLTGIITDGDLRRHMGTDLLDKTAEDIMTKSPKTVSDNMLAAEALAVMNDNKIQSLFICEGSKPIGLIHLHDLLRAGVG